MDMEECQHSVSDTVPAWRSKKPATAVRYSEMVVVMLGPITLGYRPYLASAFFGLAEVSAAPRRFNSSAIALGEVISLACLSPRRGGAFHRSTVGNLLKRLEQT
jgi:hypothetical protein